MYKTKYRKDDVLVASESTTVKDIIKDKDGNLRAVYVKDGSEFADSKGRKYRIVNKSLRRV